MSQRGWRARIFHGILLEGTTQNLTAGDSTVKAKKLHSAQPCSTHLRMFPPRWSRTVRKLKRPINTMTSFGQQKQLGHHCRPWRNILHQCRLILTSPLLFVEPHHKLGKSENRTRASNRAKSFSSGWLCMINPGAQDQMTCSPPRWKASANPTIKWELQLL